MLKCPYDDYECGLRQQLALHLRMGHPKYWKGTIEASLPPGFDVGEPDEAAIKAFRLKQSKAMKGNRNATKPDSEKQGKNTWYHRLTLQQRIHRNKMQRLRRINKAKKEGRVYKERPKRRGGLWECPYCSYSTLAYGGKKRHMKAFHPNETGLASMRKPALALIKRADEVVAEIDAMIPETLEDRIIRAVAERLYQDMKGIDK